ncbi:MAG TPA: nuclear transport factor 2 family protein [Candidatus Binataceae bacterium]|jgi:hypothetical protein|nr:nuclear transport factor 2 family protein [Candidatus Binataceae bacterium]
MHQAGYAALLRALSVRSAAISLALLAPCLLRSPVLAQAAPAGRIVTTTRLVAEFSDLESRLNLAIQRKDKAALNKLLSPDFEEWTPAPPGAPIPLERWMDKVLSGNVRSFEIRQMAVETIGEAAVVSFVEARRALCDGRECASTSFVVDLWQREGGTRRLRARYASESSPPSSVTPATPSGRE